MATSIPPGKQTFLDPETGALLSLGTVTHYIPSTTIFKNTWADEDQTEVNTNPITLDATGSCAIWGSGLYRQILKDSAGNVIWDLVTGFVGGGAGGGDVFGPGSSTPGHIVLWNDTDGTSIDDGGASLGPAQGGTGATSVPTNGQIPIGNGTNYVAANITAGTGITITNAAGSITIDSSGGAGGPYNYLPNTQWQVRTRSDEITAFKPDGTQFSGFAVSAYTTGSNTVVCSCADTTGLRVGMIGKFTGAAHADMKITAARISAIVTNASFTVALPRGLVGAASAACTFTPIMRGDQAGTSIVGPDGWEKTSNLKLWVEDDPTVLADFPGCSRVLCVKKTDASDAAVYWSGNESSLDIGVIRPLLGRPVVFGFKGKRVSGSGTIRPILTSGAGATSTFGPTVTDGWSEITQTPVYDSTALKAQIYLQGAANDVFRIGLTTLAVGNYLGGTNAYSKPPNAILIPDRSYSPISWRSVSWTAPTTVSALGGSDYGVTFRLYEESDGVYTDDILGLHIALGAAQATAGAALAIRNKEEATPLYCSPWLRTQVNSRSMISPAALAIFRGGALFVYTDTSGAAFTSVEFDCGAVLL